MTSLIVRVSNRRRFLQYLAGSPLFASGAISAYGTEAPSKLPDPMIWAPADGELIKSPKDAINVFDFEPVANQNVPPAHFGYTHPVGGVDAASLYGCAPGVELRIVDENDTVLAVTRFSAWKALFIRFLLDYWRCWVMGWVTLSGG
jgi:hypothetical protein